MVAINDDAENRLLVGEPITKLGWSEGGLSARVFFGTGTTRKQVDWSAKLD
jgi:hypothetical protein